MRELDETAFTERELKIFKEIQEYAKKYQMKKVVLFGSRARRTNREKSDIDLAVYGCSDVTEFYFDIEEEVNTLLMFDVIDMDRKNISKDLLQEIEREYRRQRQMCIRDSYRKDSFMGKELQIRNSTVDFLVFTRDAGEDGIEVRVQNHDVWLTQKAISQLFDVDRSVVTKHLKNVFEEKELDENSVCAKFAQTADDGKTYQYKFYSLAAIIAVGYRINSERAVQFRTWATKVLETFTKQGYVLDKSRLINGQIFDEDYFEHLIAEIQEIRASERRFYQKITDIYATAVDYDKNSQVTREFYATVQNKMHYAVHGNTAAEVIVARANHNKEHMGLTSWKNAPDGKIVKTDVTAAKNYLQKEELAELNEIVTMYLDYATRQARRHIPMTMEDWKTKLDAFLRFNDAEVLQDKGKITAAIAKEFAESEFEKYRVIQDSLYESDFDKLMKNMES